MSAGGDESGELPDFGGTILAEITDEHPIVIPRGEAQIALSRALDELTRAYRHVEAVGMAIARQLDAQSQAASR